MLAGECGPFGNKVSGRSLEHHQPAVVSRSRPEINNPVRVGHNGLMVFNDYHRFAGINKPVEESE